MDIPQSRHTRLITLPLVTLLFILFSNQVIAAAVDIVIREKGTGDPVADATVVINNTLHDTTKANGRISFNDITFPFELKVLATGYVTYTQTRERSNTPLIIYIEPEILQGETLEVVAERVKEKTSKIQLRAEELRKAPGSRGDPLKVIQSLPGVTNAGPQVLVRGSQARENRTWVNRLTTDYLFHWFDIASNSSVIHADLVNDFNIFLGGFPVEYPDGLGGMFDVNLRPPKSGRQHVSFNLGWNESGGIVEGPLPGLSNTSYLVAARRSNLDLFLKPEVIEKLAPQAPDITLLPGYYDSQAMINYAGTKNKIELLMLTSGDQVSLLREGSAEVDPQLKGQFEIDVGFTNVGFNWYHHYDQKLELINTLEYRTQRERQIVGTDENGDPFYVEGNYWQAAWHPSVSLNLNKNSSLLTGSEFIYAYYPVDLYMVTGSGSQVFNFTTAPKVRVKTIVRAGSYAPYIKLRQHLGPQLTTTLGLRYTGVRGSHGIEMGGLAPRVNIEYQWQPAILLTANWGKYYQLPREQNLLKDYGNPGLAFTEAEHRILGIQIKLSTVWKLQTEAWHKPMENLVISAPADPPDNYRNAQSGEAYGLDILLKRNPVNRRFAWFAYSYSHATRTNELTNETSLFGGDQPHNLILMWSQPFPFKTSKWDLGLKFQIRSGKPYTPIVGRDNSTCLPPPYGCLWQPVLGERNSKRLPVYYKADLRLDRTVRFNTWTMKYYFDLINLTARKNIVGYSYGENYSNYANPTPVTTPGIVFPFFGVEMKF